MRKAGSIRRGMNILFLLLGVWSLADRHGLLNMDQETRSLVIGELSQTRGVLRKRWIRNRPDLAFNQADHDTVFSGAFTSQYYAKFKQCGAPICLLDESWRKHKHLDGERSDRLPATSVLAPLQAKVVSDVYLDINARYGPIRRRLWRTMLTPSRLHSRGL